MDRGWLGECTLNFIIFTNKTSQHADYGQGQVTEDGTGDDMANSINKSGVVITEKGVHSIIREAKAMLNSHYSPQALACKDLCTDRGSITHHLFQKTGL